MGANPTPAKELESLEVCEYKALLGKSNYPEKSRHSDEIERLMDYLVVRRQVAHKPIAAKERVETENIQQEFSRLAEQWYLDTLVSSDYLEKILHPAYQRIIGLGKDVIPLILRELQDMPSDWFWALRALTKEGEDPVKPEHAGQPEEMAKDWITWGKKNQLI